jgi:hypothetical protein
LGGRERVDDDDTAELEEEEGELTNVEVELYSAGVLE